MRRIQVPKKKMSQDELINALDTIPDEVLQRISFSTPWQYSSVDTSGRQQDEDGFSSLQGKEDDASLDRDALQKACFAKFHSNPHVNTSVRGMVGRLTGLGFGTSCGEVYKIHEAVEEIELDQRNRLYNYWPKWIGRYNIEGELHLCFTAHKDGFVEVDFVDPGVVAYGGDANSGIIYHPSKPTMPLFYNIKKTGEESKKIAGGSTKDKLSEQIPSIYVARYPELVSLAANHKDFDSKLQEKSKNKSQKYKKTGGYYRFIVSWDRGLMTRRAVSYLRTVLEWLNHYEILKKYEIDHKKASGSYVWVFSFDDVKAFRTWLTLTDDEKRKTAVGAKLTPGGRLILPPGMSVKAESPTLPQIKDEDTDILQMVASGLNEPADILTGTSAGTFSSVKASRGPFSDRVSDEIAFFDRFLRHDFWGNIFYLKSVIAEFPSTFKVQRAVRFEKKKPIFKNVDKRPELLIQISYPTSDLIDIESRARGLLGVKHGPMAEQLGVSNKWVAERVGIGNYDQTRLDKATEEEMYPELVYEAGVDAESTQEKVEGEKKKEKNVEKVQKQMEDILTLLSLEIQNTRQSSSKESEKQLMILSQFVENVAALKSEINKPINVTVEPAAINFPKSDDNAKAPIIFQEMRGVRRKKKFDVVRGEDGLVLGIREKDEDSSFEVIRAEDGKVIGIKEKDDAKPNLEENSS